VYKHLAKPEKNGKTIGKFRIITSIFGGLLLSYLSMSLLTLILQNSPGENIIMPLLFNTMAWACCSLWIVISPTKLTTLL